MLLPKSGWRRDLTLGLVLATLAAVVRLPRLGFPPEEIFDEVYHAKTALEYLEGRPPTEWVHPPTAKLLIAIGVWRFGYNAWAWRLLPALAGIALAPVFFFLAKAVLEKERAALIASLLLLCDGVYLVQSRTAMTNIFAVLFQVSAALFILKAARSEGPPLLLMTLAGCTLGLAFSTRWTSLWAGGFLGIVFLVVRFKHLRAQGPARWSLEAALLVFAFILVPSAIYTLSYVPWMRQGHSFSEMVRWQADVWHYHASLRANHPYFSRWYTWPLLYRPTWYYYKSEPGFARGIIALGNPALWWASVPVTVWALVSGAKARDPRRLFSGAGFLALYLPWGVSPRTLNYSHYLFEAIPYACLSLGILLDREWDSEWAAPLARGYLVLTAFLFLFFFPMLTALPVREGLFQRHLWTWFPTWI